MNITKFAIPEIIFGHGSLRYISTCALRLGAKHVFLVSDKGVEQAGWVDIVTQFLAKEGLTWSYFSAISQNPKDYEIEAGAQYYKEEGADIIIALGGGSAIDAAKGIAILAGNGGLISDYEGANQINHPLPPMIIVTTTAGSGADVSQFAIITDTARRVKMSIISRSLMPNISIIDPELLTTKSPIQIIYSAADSLSHAIEAYVSKLASPFTGIQALQAIRLIYKYLPIAVETGSPQALEKLSIASVSSSMAFSNASLGAVHALAHALGGHFDVPHGAIHPILLPHVMRFNLEECPEKFAQITAVMCAEIDHNGSAYEQGFSGIELIERFFKDFSVNTSLAALIGEQNRDQLAKIAQIATNDACILTNPKDATWQDLERICMEAWK